MDFSSTAVYSGCMTTATDERCTRCGDDRSGVLHDGEGPRAHEFAHPLAEPPSGTSTPGTGPSCPYCGRDTSGSEGWSGGECDDCHADTAPSGATGVFTLSFDCDNAAFEDDRAGETARILERLAEEVGNGRRAGAVVDLNGNVVGSWGFSS